MRSETEIERAREAVARSGIHHMSRSFMHDAKGTEFLGVAVIASDAYILPNEKRILAAKDEYAL